MEMTDSGYKKLIIDLPAEQHTTLKALAKKRDVSMGAIVRNLINRHLVEEKTKQETKS